MRLTDLDPMFMHYDRKSGGQREVANIGEANGIWFMCPKCDRHGILCWTPDVPDGVTPGPGRWKMTGTGFGDLTLYPSIDLSKSPGCDWHGFVTNGEAS